VNTGHPIRQLAPEVLDQLRSLDSCTVSNAIERLAVRQRNEGFTDSSVRCLSPDLPPMAGYAATGRIRTSVAPTTRHWYYHHPEWWEYISTIPAPRVIVPQDVDERPGLGAIFGEIHAHIGRALECVAYVTNGSVRDLPGIEKTGFHLFATGIAVSHAYAHLVDFGHPVEVGGLTVKPGDLLHGDLHGVVSVPSDIAGQVPAIAAEMLVHERELIRLCQSSHFSLRALRAQIERTRHESQ
jgi:regulator of RNase E activity RraA